MTAEWGAITISPALAERPAENFPRVLFASHSLEIPVEPGMKQTIKNILNQAPYIKSLSRQVANQGAHPAGHYYSPIPSEDEVRQYLRLRQPPGNGVPGIDLNREGQWELLQDYSGFYADLPFVEKETAGRRYHYENGWFNHSDAIFLYSFLRKFAPKRIVEVGSGFSSAVMLETLESVPLPDTQLTCVEPDPERLNSRLSPGDKQRVTIIDKKVQDVPRDLFATLSAGDLLFIDSSHVVKCGSDLHYLMFEILPLLRTGVFVHFHDVFYPFDYPADWLAGGRYWNENYFLRAFLTNNSAWKTVFFNTYAHHAFGDFIRERMPLCLNDQGGSLYLQRIADD